MRFKCRLAAPNPGTSLQTVFLEFLQICFAATGHSFSETQKAVRQRTDYNLVCTVLVQQAVGDGIHCFDRDYRDTELRQSRYAKHVTAVEIPPQILGRPSEEHDVEWNDDLVGFFNAVPRKDMLRSVHTIVREYQQHTGCSVLSIDLLSKTGHPGNPRGRTKSSLKRCCIHDIPAIVELSFSTGVFTAAGKCRAQVEGTAQAQIVESQAVAFASEVQQQAQSRVQAMAADMESQARNRVQAIEQQAQARVSEVSIEASRQLAVANDTIVSLKQQNEMLARQQQDLCGQIATLQNMVAEVKASAVNTSVPQIPTTQNGAEITEALKAMASRVGQTMNALKEAVIGSPKAKGRSKVAKAPIPYFSSPPPYACERSSSVSFDKWGTFINAHCLCSTEICL